MNVDKTSYKKRTTSERRSHKKTSGGYKPVGVDQDHYSTQKYHSKYTSAFSKEGKEFYSAKHVSSKFEKNTPKQSKYYSKFEANDKHKSKNLNTSKLSSHDRHSERHSSRKRERSDRYKHRGKLRSSPNFMYYLFYY